ncbi:MAG TPA: osmotically inducible protein OsmC [Bacteroidetes bacterium]|nr:osmotically inducible protein OsmC [Bacteroidota bacterium]
MTAELIYKGELRTEMKHHLSGNIVVTDAPPDNQGKGEAFSPTDIVAAATGSCALTVMGIAARTHQIDMDGTRVEVLKVMMNNPRKISEIHLDFYFPSKSYSDKEKSILENTARTCPVILSLHDDVKKVLRFHY